MDHVTVWLISFVVVLVLLVLVAKAEQDTLTLGDLMFFTVMGLIPFLQWVITLFMVVGALKTLEKRGVFNRVVLDFRKKYHQEPK